MTALWIHSVAQSNLFGIRDLFLGRQFFMGAGMGKVVVMAVWFGDASSTLHLLCTLFLAHRAVSCFILKLLQAVTSTKHCQLIENHLPDCPLPRPLSCERLPERSPRPAPFRPSPEALLPASDPGSPASDPAPAFSERTWKWSERSEGRTRDFSFL